MYFSPPNIINFWIHPNSLIKTPYWYRHLEQTHSYIYFWYILIGTRHIPSYKSNSQTPRRFDGEEDRIVKKKKQLPCSSVHMKHHVVVQNNLYDEISYSFSSRKNKHMKRVQSSSLYFGYNCMACQSITWLAVNSVLCTNLYLINQRQLPKILTSHCRIEEKRIQIWCGNSDIHAIKIYVGSRWNKIGWSIF